MGSAKEGPRRTKGTGGVYQRASDGMWCASLELPSSGGRRRRKVIVRARKSDALIALREAKQDLDRVGDLRTSGASLGQWCDLWWKRYGMSNLKVSTRDTYRSKIEQYIKPSIGRIRLDRLSVDHVYRLHSYVIEEKGLSASSAHAAHRVLAVLLADAEKEGRVSRNVAHVADKPRVAKVRKVYLDNAQARTLLLSVADDQAERAAWTTAILTGMRQGERLGLTRDLIDLDAGTVTVAWQLKRLSMQHGCLDEKGAPTCGRVRGGNCPARHLEVPADQEVRQVEGGLFLTRPKSRAGWRVVPLVGLVREALALHLENNRPGLEGLVFTRAGGRPIDPADDSAAWRAALTRAGLPLVDGHSARHTCNTVLTEVGVPVDVRRQILGHASNAVNEVYTHTSDARVAEAMKALSEAMDYR